MALDRHAALLSLALAACGPPKLPFDPQSDESSSSSSDGSTFSSATSTETSTTFVPEYDLFVSECQVFAQDCPDGEKCVPYSFMGTHYNGSKCVPVTGNQAAGEPCSYGGPGAATDDCDENSGCWSIHEVDGEQVGTCHAFCSGTTDNPQCPAGSSCWSERSGIWGFCVFTCDPVVQDCGPGLGCYWANIQFTCTYAPQNFPAGEPCGFINDCAPGLTCAPAEELPTCNGAACCTPFCYLSVGDSQCVAIPGTGCQPFFEAGTAPPGDEDIGVCIVPAP